MRQLSPREWQAHPGKFIALWTGATYAYALYQPGELVATALIDGIFPPLPHAGAAWFQRPAHEIGVWPEFAPHPGEGVHHLGLGPVHGLIAEPAYFRFSLLGEQVLKLQVRLGYSHRAVLDLIRGKSPRVAARFAARISGDATVAHSLAFARAAEAALGLEIPARASTLRVVMLELERLANHTGDLADIADAESLEARLAWHREAICRAAAAAFGHRLMMDMIIPGGVAGDINLGGADAIIATLDALEAELPRLDFAGLQHRLANIGVISPALVEAFAAPLTVIGDVAARIGIRLAEIAASIRDIRETLDALPDTTIAIAPPSLSGSGLGMAMSFRGPVWVWLAINGGNIADVFIADPSMYLWPLLEHAATSGNLADFPVIAKSINPCAAAVDL